MTEFCLYVQVLGDALFWQARPEKWHLHRVSFDDARDKPLIDVSRAHGLNEPRPEAFLSPVTDGEKPGTDSPPFPRPLPPSSSSISPSLCVCPSLPIIHPHASFGCLPLLERVSPPWISAPSTCHPRCGPTGSCVWCGDARLSGSQQRPPSGQTRRWGRARRCLSLLERGSA